MIKKGLIKLMALLLVGATFFGAAACTKRDKGNNTDDITTEKLTFSGTHVYNATETSKDFIKDGTCDYTLVVPEVATYYIRTAQSEFTYFFKKATNIDLQVVKDTSLITKDHTESGKYISLGETTLLKSTDINYDKKTLTSDGGRIVTKDNSIYIVGGYDTGTMFAVYTFMRLTFNYECYSPSTIVIDENVKDLKLKNYDVTDIPDFEERTSGLGSANNRKEWDTYDETNYAHRMGYRDGNNTVRFRMHQIIDDPDNPGQLTVNPDRYKISTSTDTVINKEKMMGTHPDWFSTIGNQWCYTARGKADELDKLTDAAAMSVTYALKTYTPEEYPLPTVCSLTQEDNDYFCGCAACSAEVKKYGSHSGAIVKFMNIVSDKVAAWMEKPENAAYKRDNLKIEFFAYGATMYPPVVKNEKGEYEAVDEDVIPRGFSHVYIANIFADYQSSIYADVNEEARYVLQGWKALTNQITYFTYNTQRRGFMYFYDSFNHYTSEGFQYYANVSNKSMYVESQGSESGTPSTWHNLKMYLVSRLSWDCTLNDNELIDNYFKAVYGPGATAMREFFDAQRLYYSIQNKEKNMATRWTIYNYVNEKFDWPVNVLDSWIDKCDEALKAVEVYKNVDYEKYDMYSRSIEIEAISPIYIMLDQNQTGLSAAKRSVYVDRLKEDCKRWNFSKMVVVHVPYVGDTFLTEYIETL